ncbi:hypothetical protein, partial [Listeria monocytogenes]|uniref:hypothetical protein n=1 Tax=Listeria monocytogenes TaxID=1639 RepID=UPI002FDC73F5
MNRFIGLNDVKEAPANPYLGVADLVAVKSRILTAINALVDVDTEDMARVRQLLKSQLLQCTQAIEA